MSHYVHHVPGRLRVKAPTLKRNPARAAGACAAITALYGVSSAEANPVTGSLLVTYDPIRIDPRGVLDRLAEDGVIGRDVEIPAPSQVSIDVGRLAADATGNLGNALVGVLVEKLVERSAVALVAAVL
jgi:hypothetical protein